MGRFENTIDSYPTIRFSLNLFFIHLSGGNRAGNRDYFVHDYFVVYSPPNPVAMQTLPTCLVIDNDSVAADQLTGLLKHYRLALPVAATPSVALAAGLLRELSVDLLFIRISFWEEYLAELPQLRQPPRWVIFLSARSEKCTFHLSTELDFHLRPPYNFPALRAIFSKLASPLFEPRSLAFFFLKVNWRLRVIYFSTLKCVYCQGRTLRVETDTDDYSVSGSLADFQRRCPIPLNRVGRDLMIAVPQTLKTVRIGK